MLGKTDLLERELHNINYNGRTHEHRAYYEMTLHTEEEDFKLGNPENVDLVRDYVGNVTDLIIINFRMPLGDFIRHVFPVRDNVRCTLVYNNIGVETTIRYKLVFKDIDRDIISGNKATTTYTEQNLEELTPLSAQLINETYMEISTKNVFGIFKDASIMDIISVNISEELNKSTFSGEIESKGVDFRIPDNDRVYDQTIIEAGQQLLSLPTLFQNGDQGIYNGDIGSYLQSDGIEELFYIYPLYRADERQIISRILKLIVVTDKMLGGMNNTYTLDEDYITIAVEQGRRDDDDGDTTHLSKGIGYQSTESLSMMHRPFQVDPTKVKTNPVWTMRKRLHKEPTDNNYKTLDVGINANEYKIRSTFLKNDGRHVIVQWKLSCVHWLKPGMSVEFFEEKEGMIVKHAGVLLGVHSVTTTDTDTESSTLNVFIDNNSFEEIL